MNIFVGISIFLFGLAFGSFFNVCIYRIPEKKSILTPPSHCPKCGQNIKMYDNIPIISYIFLGRKCRYCQEKISIRYPIVELITGIVFFLSYFYFDLNLYFFASIFFLSILIIVSFIDLDHQIIPNKIIFPSIPLLFVFAIIARPEQLIQIIIGGFIGGAFLLLLAMIWPGGMGGGDIKLALFIGIFLGYYIIEVLFFAFLLGAITGIIMISIGKKSRKDLLPFGPFLSIAAFITLFWGSKIFDAYKSFYT